LYSQVKDEGVKKHTSVEKAITNKELKEENRLLKRHISELEEKICRMEKHTSADKLNTTEKLEQENILLRTKLPDLEEKIHKLEDQLQCTSRILSEKQTEIDNLNTKITIMKKGPQWSEIIDLQDTTDKLKKSKADLELRLEDSRKKTDTLNAKISEKDSVINRMITEMNASEDHGNDTKESVNTNTGIVTNIPARQVKADSEFQNKTVLPERPNKVHKIDNRKAENRSNTNDRKERCKGCYVTHWPEDCRMKYQICFNCRQTGHTAACCTNKKLYHVQQPK
jgi:chromosome segregation ATPase